MILVITFNTFVNMLLVLSVGFKGVFYVTARYTLLAFFWTRKLCRQIAEALKKCLSKVVGVPFQKLIAWWDIKKTYFDPIEKTAKIEDKKPKKEKKKPTKKKQDRKKTQEI